MLRCTRVVYCIDATKAEYSQSWSRPMCKHDAIGFGLQRGTLLSGVVVVPSTSKGKLCYAITEEPNGKSLSGHELDWGGDILSILHADVNYDARDRIEKKIARITPSVVQQFDWRPLVVPEGHTVAQALTHMLCLRCNGADQSLAPSAFEYSWSIVHVQPEGTEKGQLVGGASFDNCTEGVARDEDIDYGEIKFKSYQYCEAIAVQVERYWHRAADAFFTYAAAHSDGPAVSGVRSADDDTDDDVTDDVNDSNAEGNSSGANSGSSSSSSKKAATKKSKKKRARTTRA
jgi:hypothetical protein